LNSHPVWNSKLRTEGFQGKYPRYVLRLHRESVETI
jgi:hypothetical protein